MKLITTQKDFTENKTSNWRDRQLQLLKATDIQVDYNIKQFMSAHPDYVYNLTYASDWFKTYASDNNLKVSSEKFDFFINCDMEFGKLPVDVLEQTIKQQYQTSTQGGYIAFQSYYLNWQNDTQFNRLDLDDSMDRAVVQWVERYLGINNYTNECLQIDNPLTNVTDNGEIIAGADFMYTHGNIRFWLWK